MHTIKWANLSCKFIHLWQCYTWITHISITIIPHSLPVNFTSIPWGNFILISLCYRWVFWLECHINIMRQYILFWVRLSSLCIIFWDSSIFLCMSNIFFYYSLLIHSPVVRFWTIQLTQILGIKVNIGAPFIGTALMIFNIFNNRVNSGGLTLKQQTWGRCTKKWMRRYAWGSIDHYRKSFLV